MYQRLFGCEEYWNVWFVVWIDVWKKFKRKLVSIVKNYFLQDLKKIGNVLSNRPLSIIHHDEWLEIPLSLTKRCFVGKLICLSLWIIATLTPNKVIIGRNICIDIMEDIDRNKYQRWKDFVKELWGHHQYKHTRTGADTAFQRGKLKLNKVSFH